ncbi:MAG: hypothetical protein QGI45_06000 [Myxococcota bacterium]|jgi:hypothetical protein|nr:hypothetical protein [Myxococcota bacterium]
MKQRILLLSLSALLASVVSCGPNYHWDEGPSPDWTREIKGIRARQISMVGMAPATPDVQRDVELATRDAQARIAKLFYSEISSRSVDWQVASVGGLADEERNVAQQTIEVYSEVKVDDINVQVSFRDEETKSQYVGVTVNRVAWANKLADRINASLGEIEKRTLRASGELKKKQALSAYKDLMEAYQFGFEIETDVIVMDLLDASSEVAAKLTAYKDALDELRAKVQKTYPIKLGVFCADERVSKSFNGNLTEFFKGRGFRVLEKGFDPKAIVIRGEMEQHMVNWEKVANRTEYIHAANGSLKVLEPSGKEVNHLSVQLSGDGYTERATNKEEAKLKALQLAADTLAAKLRSNFRRIYPPVGD